MAIGGRTRVYAVLGRPVDHSLSPAIHNAWFAHHGIDAVYVALDVPPDRGAALPEALRTLGLAGANLTVPHKAAILPLLDHADDDVRLLGAANTIVRTDTGWAGHNTDVGGFVAGFEARFGAGSLAGRRAIVLGAGGAARAVGLGLLRAGVGSLTFLNRTPARARAAAASLAAAAPGPIGAEPLDPAVFRDVAAGADLVVNALTGPAAPAVAALDPAVLGPGAVWVDLNYWMPDPPLRTRCAALGIAFLDGLPMLVHQAALAFARFTGVHPDPVHARAVLG